MRCGVLRATSHCVRPLLRSVVVGAVLVGGLGLVPPLPGAAQGGVGRVDDVVDGDSPWAASLGSVVIELGDRSSLVAELRHQQSVSTTAAEQQAAAALAHDRVQRARRARSADHARTRLVLDEVDAVLVRNDGDLAAYAVATYVGGRSADLASSPHEAVADPLPVLIETVGAELVTVRRSTLARRAGLEAHLGRLGSEVAALTAEGQRLADDRDSAALLRLQAEHRAAALVDGLDAGLWSASVAGTDLPLIALDAYVVAARRMAVEQPGCGVRWWQLAAIGRVESGHGTAQGNRLGPDSRTTGRILGVALDGNGVAAIADTDGGRLDGDVVWDRAVGPMQFIPSTWALLGADGDGDGRADPHNLRDATWSAARHLCRSASGLGDPEQYRRGLLGYNRSTAYGTTVMGWAERYRAAVDVPGG
jgi:hypothetical protein